MQVLFITLVLLGILAINYNRYFVDYVSNLPNKNLDFGSEIAKKIDTLSDNAEIYIFGCCWGEAGQPNPGTIGYALAKQRKVISETGMFFKTDDPIFNCQKFKELSEYIIVSPPYWTSGKEKIKNCIEGGEFYDINKNSEQIGWIYYKK